MNAFTYNAYSHVYIGENCAVTSTKSLDFDLLPAGFNVIYINDASLFIASFQYNSFTVRM